MVTVHCTIRNFFVLDMGNLLKNIVVQVSLHRSAWWCECTLGGGTNNRGYDGGWWCWVCITTACSSSWSHYTWCSSTDTTTNTATCGSLRCSTRWLDRCLSCSTWRACSSYSSKTFYTRDEDQSMDEVVLNRSETWFGEVKSVFLHEVWAPQSATCSTRRLERCSLSTGVSLFHGVSDCTGRIVSITHYKNTKRQILYFMFQRKKRASSKLLLVREESFVTFWYLAPLFWEDWRNLPPSNRGQRQPRFQQRISSLPHHPKQEESPAT